MLAFDISLTFIITWYLFLSIFFFFFLIIFFLGILISMRIGESNYHNKLRPFFFFFFFLLLLKILNIFNTHEERGNLCYKFSVCVMYLKVESFWIYTTISFFITSWDLTCLLGLPTLPVSLILHIYIIIVFIYVYYYYIWF